MRRRTGILLELGLFFLASYVWLSQTIPLSNWWQLLSLWVVLLLLVFITEKRACPSIGIIIAGILAILGWLFIVRIDQQLGFFQWRGLMLGAIAYLTALIINWHNIRHKYINGLISLVILVFTLIFGETAGGAKAWLNIAGIRFQPIEFARIFLLVFLAGYFYDNRELLKIDRRWPNLRYWGPLFLLMAGMFLFLGFQRDLGPALVFYLVFITLALYICFNWYSVFLYILTSLAGILVTRSVFNHLQQRISVWLNPWNDPHGAGYQIIQGLLTVSNGGFFGAGLGQGLGVNIPAIHTDYIFALICEEVGFIGATLILVFYFLLLFFGLKAGQNLSGKSHILAVGIVLLWGYQVFIVIGGILKIIPLSGMTLPFLSYGSSSLIANMWLLGTLTKLAKPSYNYKLIQPKKPNSKKLLVNFLVLFSVLWCALGYWQIIRVDLAEHPSNPKNYLVFQKMRGKIYDRNGELLAETEPAHGFLLRKYYGPAGLSHIIGYFHPRYGITGLEQVYNKQLANEQDLYLTIDLQLQTEIEDIFQDSNGAVVVLQPKTGELLAVHSAPAIDSNLLEEKWQQYQENPNSPFYNRAFNGMYPPGSAVKPLVLAAAYQTALTHADSIWIDQGRVEFENQSISNFNGAVYGEITTQEALVFSSNVVFAHLAVKLCDELITYCRSFGLGEPVGVDLNGRKGNLPSAQLNPFAWAQIGIGQGELLVTPLQMACAIGTIANGGIRMEPYLVKAVSGSWFRRMIRRPKSICQVITQHQAHLVREAMIAAVDYGTGQAAKIEPVLVAGKTGTAEINRGEPHSWFVGFAPADDPKFVVTVIIEHGGSGGGLAAQKAKQIFLAALKGDLMNGEERLIP